jgi:hypothetical protein
LSVRPSKVKAAIEVARKAGAVSGAVYLVYKAISVGYAPQVIAIGSSHDQAISLAEQHELSQHLAGKSPDDLVFTAVQGGVLRNRNARRAWFNRAAAAIGEPHLTPHELRHTAASLAVSAGANVKAVQRMLGHAFAVMTLDRYADLFEDDLDAVATRLDAMARAAGVAPMLPEAVQGDLPVRADAARGQQIRACCGVGDTGIEPVTPAV